MLCCNKKCYIRCQLSIITDAFNVELEYGPMSDCQLNGMIRHDTRIGILLNEYDLNEKSISVKVSLQRCNLMLLHYFNM